MAKRVRMEGSDTEKKKPRTVDDCLANIHKKYGKESIRRFGSKDIVKVATISTGSYLLDRATYIGGVPRGRIVEFLGPEMSGKTTLALHVIANAQKDGLVAAFIDAEHALSTDLCKNLNVNLNELLISQPDCGEQALDIAQMLVESTNVGLVVIDSVSALVPRAELEGEMGDAQMGLQARLMSQAMRKLTAIVAKSNTCIIFINQIRQKIGVTWGSNETTSGGNALKFYASMRLDIRSIGKLKKGNEIIGNRVKINVKKNKLAPPFRQIETDLIFGKGINREAELIDIAVEHNVIEKAGSWFSYKDDKIGQGKEAVCEWLKANPDMIEKILTELRVEHGEEI